MSSGEETRNLCEHHPRLLRRLPVSLHTHFHMGTWAQRSSRQGLAISLSLAVCVCVRLCVCSPPLEDD